MPVTRVAMVGTVMTAVTGVRNNAGRVAQTLVVTVAFQGTSESLARVNALVVVEMVCVPN